MHQLTGKEIVKIKFESLSRIIQTFFFFLEFNTTDYYYLPPHYLPQNTNRTFRKENRPKSFHETTQVPTLFLRIQYHTP